MHVSTREGLVVEANEPALSTRRLTEEGGQDASTGPLEQRVGHGAAIIDDDGRRRQARPTGTQQGLVAAALAMLGGMLNRYVVVPRALRPGGRTRSDIKGMDHEGSTARFASEGAGRRTRQLHRMVVLLVVVMLAGLVGHGMTPLALL